MLIKDFHHVFSVDEYPAAARCFFRVPISIQERYWQYVVSRCIDEEGLLDASRLFFPIILAMRVLMGVVLFSAVGLAVMFVMYVSNDSLSSVIASLFFSPCFWCFY